MNKTQKTKPMIKYFLAITAICMATWSCGGDASQKVNNNNELASIENSKPTSNLITIGEFDTKAADFVDKEVVVEGIVDHVCKHGGKKLFLVSDEGDLHVESDERFDENLKGSEVIVNGIVREFRVDEAYCLKMEDDNIQSHKKGDTDEDLYTRKMKQIESYRDSMLTANTDHLSFYSIEYVSLEVKDIK